PTTVNLASSAITTTVAKDVLFAASYSNGAGGTWIAGTSYTLRENSTSSIAYASEDYLTTTTVTNSCPIDINISSIDWTGECMAIKPAAAASAPIPMRIVQ